jgi:solute carrier family 35 protein F5
MAYARSRFAFGLLCLAAVVFLWVVSSVALQFLFQQLSYSKPFFATYFATSLFSVLTLHRSLIHAY